MQYRVYMPIAGYVSMLVHANSEKEAIEYAHQNDVRLEDYLDPKRFDVVFEEYEFCNQIVEGNVFRGPLNKAYAEEE